jgi:hypothetical protein
MGQYGNQPDFATRAESITTLTDTISSATKLNSAALYVGVGGDLSVIIAGTANPTLADAVVFKGIVAGSFVPIIVDYVLATNTSASEIIALY